MVLESLICAIRQEWTIALRIPLWLMSGRAHLKRKLAERVTIDASSEPLRQCANSHDHSTLAIDRHGDLALLQEVEEGSRIPPLVRASGPGSLGMPVKS